MNLRKKIKFIVSVLSFMMLTIEMNSQAPPVISIGIATYSAGTFTVPVTVTGFINVGNISMKLNYDTAKVEYKGVTLNSGLLPGNTVTTPVTDQSGVFRLSYSSGSAIVPGSPANILLGIHFDAKPGIDGVQTLLTWSPFQGDCDVTPPLPEVFTPTITSANLSTYFINGFLNIPPVPQINGNDSICVNGTAEAYSTATGMNGYVWEVSPDGTIVTGAGTNSITVLWTIPGAKTVSLTYTDPITGTALTPTLLPVNAEACTKTLNLYVFPEGLYLGDGMLHQAQGVAGNQYSGSVADKITIELHDAGTYSTIIHSTGNIDINTNGSITAQIPGNFNGSYYVTVKHRNSIAVITALPLVFSTAVIDYNFSTAKTKAYGSNLKSLGTGMYGMYAGDVNNDGIVDGLDLISVGNNVNLFSVGYLVSDLNGDGMVDALDLILTENNSLSFASVINPI